MKHAFRVQSSAGSFGYFTLQLDTNNSPTKQGRHPMYAAQQHTCEKDREAHGKEGEEGPDKELQVDIQE